MTGLKTRRNDREVVKFLEGIDNEQKKQDCYTLLGLMKDVTNEEPVMWGDSIVVFGSYHYKYESGREGDWFLAGFSPRKQNLAIYIVAGFKSFSNILEKLGKFKISVSCLYVKKLEDIDQEQLKELVRQSVNQIKLKYT